MIPVLSCPASSTLVQSYRYLRLGFWGASGRDERGARCGDRCFSSGIVKHTTAVIIIMIYIYTPWYHVEIHFRAENIHYSIIIPG